MPEYLRTDGERFNFFDEATPDLLDQIFRYLISNAIRHRHPTRPLLIYLESERKDNEKAFFVKDNGIRVPEQYQE